MSQPFGSGETTGWVEQHLDLRLRTRSSPLGLQVGDLVRLAVRRNPKRAHLLVSRVLGKHLPVHPQVVVTCQRLLGLVIADALAPVGSTPVVDPTWAPDVRAAVEGGDSGPLAERVEAALRALRSAHVDAPKPVVLGFAETATALGYGVAEALAAEYLHSTRRPAPAGVTPVDFTEPHSHAADHRLVPADPGLLADPRTLVLVDDEISTARTARNVIEALQQVAPREHYVIASYVDMRSEQDRADLAAWATEHGLRVDLVSLVSGAIHLPEGLPAAADTLTRAVAAVDAPPADGVVASGHTLQIGWAPGLPLTAESGLDQADQRHVEQEAVRVADELADRLREAGLLGTSLHVLGTEEFIQVPALVGAALARRLPHVAVTFSTTTRSPVVPIDDPGYPLRTSVAFERPVAAGDTPHRFAHNAVPTGELSPEHTVLVLVEQAEETGTLLAALTSRGLRVVEVTLADTLQVGTDLPLPEVLRGPEFGSYRGADVGWLLTDLSDTPLEAPTEDRELAIQTGQAHYAQSLPIEQRPTARYTEAYQAALARGAEELARQVGRLATRILARRGPDLVLASLARAGTPVGVLLRRWYAQVHGLDVPHLTLSIVRGQGVDAQALRYLAHEYGAERVQFVDGWTGKGAITHELRTSVRAVNAALGVGFDPELAVVADPGWTTGLFGTREDLLVPSACLNSTVSGLVSRTVLNEEILAPGQFHGAKFYRDLADIDVTTTFIDTVAGHFGAVAAEQSHRATDEAPTPRADWRGWQHVQGLVDEFGLPSINLVKPGVGETTRVLLRRSPERVLIDPEGIDELGHLLTLAAERGVRVEERTGLPYRAIGLVRPSESAERVGPVIP